MSTSSVQRKHRQVFSYLWLFYFCFIILCLFSCPSGDKDGKTQEFPFTLKVLHNSEQHLQSGKAQVNIIAVIY